MKTKDRIGDETKYPGIGRQQLPVKSTEEKACYKLPALF